MCINLPDLRVSVLICRPDEQGAALTEKLQAHGIHATHFSPFGLCAAPENAQAASEAYQQLAEQSAVFCVSPAAIRFSDVLLKTNATASQHAWRADLRYFAVGQKSARLLCETSHQPCRYPIAAENSEALFALMEADKLPARVLIFCAEAGRDWLANRLVTSGVAVEKQICYQRLYHAPTPVQFQRWAQEINLLVFTSLDALKWLCEQAERSNITQWLLRCDLLLNSPRAQTFAQTQGWQPEQLHLAEKADNASLFADIYTLAQRNPRLR